MSTQNTAPTPSRQPWIDVARGGSVLLVVLYHVVIWHAALLPAPGLHADLWERVNNTAGGIRMPLLLLLSGMLAAGKIERGRPALRAALANYWLYVVWLVVAGIAMALVAMPLPEQVGGPLDIVRQLVAPETTLWYLFALACYLVVMVALRPLPVWLVLVLLAIPAIVVDPGRVIALKVPALAVYFAIGVQLSGWLRANASRRFAPLLVASLVLVLVGSRLSSLATAGTAAMRASWLVGNLGKGLGAIALATLVGRLGVVARPLAWVGRHTLSIYVLHPLLLGLYLSVAGGLVATWLPRTGQAAIAYPALLVLAVAAAALALEQALRRAGATALFALPARLDVLGGRRGT